MKRSAMSSVKTPKKKEIWLACQHCSASTKHEALTCVAEFDESPGGEVQVWNDYLTIRCLGCGTVSFCIEGSCSEEYDIDPHTGEQNLATSHKLYPSRLAGRPVMRNVDDLPSDVESIYLETHSAICSDQPILTGIGIRAIIEAVCNIKSIPGRNLEVRIDGLATAGLISSNNVAFLHQIRYLGNKSAHEVEAHSNQELAAAFDIVETLLTTVFVLPKLAGSLPTRTVSSATTVP